MEIEMKLEAGIGVVMWPRAKECLGPPESGRRKEEPFPRDFEGSKALTSP